MKSTGVVRKIDELGRIVIPKEIRRTLGIRDGENLEIYIEEDKIILQKQMVIESVQDISKQLIAILNDIYDYNFLITDRDSVIAGNKEFKDLINTHISENLIHYIDNIETKISNEEDVLEFSKLKVKGYNIIMPIIVDIDVVGLLIINKTSNINESDLFMAKVITKIISEKLLIC